MPFQKGNKIGLGNEYGKANKGKIYPTRGLKHPKDCKHCLAIKTGAKFNRKAWGKAYSRKKRLEKFGITENEFDTLLKKQNGVCAICKQPPSKRWDILSIDHDHKTGKVRGLLCTTCNTMLGKLEKYFDEIMIYLKKL